MPHSSQTPDQTVLSAMLARFRDPPARCRPMPQWSWNEDMTRARITEELLQFKEQGCGGLTPKRKRGPGFRDR